MDITRIQVIFLFASYKSLPYEEREEIQQIVADKYSKQFGISPSSVQVKLCDGNSVSNLNDIVLAIESSRAVMNEGVLRGRARDAIARALQERPMMMNLGFSGKIGMKNGLLDAQEESMTSDESFGRQSEKKESARENKAISDNKDYKKRAKQYVATEPKYAFDMLRIPDDVKAQIDNALNRIKYEREVFEEWGLYAIMPSPICALSFYGAPGTGKSMAAEAIAKREGKKIIRASYADIENKYVGEGPKNVSAIFLAAEQQNAVLFIDEADSLLSKRMVNVSDPSGQAMNSMRSQLLICLENFHGIVVFATNLAVNYDRAFLSRLINVEFKRPDEKLRQEIWRAHLYASPNSRVKLKIPLDESVDLPALAKRYDFVGREIRNCVVNACVDARAKGQNKLTQAYLIRAADAIEKDRMAVENAKDETGKRNDLSDEMRSTLAEGINAHNRRMQESGKEIARISDSELKTDS